jgi:hypothetical protein
MPLAALKKLRAKVAKSGKYYCGGYVGQEVK